tara:strand:- start:2951 stop:3175 length:225 start_codon:yes stop_codon:yes gene_type:complete
VIRALIDLYILVLIVDVIVSYLPQYKHHPVAIKIKQLADFSCNPIRRVLPPHQIPFDISAIIVIAGLKVFEAIW